LISRFVATMFLLVLSPGFLILMLLSACVGCLSHPDL